MSATDVCIPRTDVYAAELYDEATTNRRGTLVVPAVSGWMIKRDSADPTSRSLRRGESEGRACHARRRAMDCQRSFSGRHKWVVPRVGGARLSCPRKPRSTRPTRERDADMPNVVPFDGLFLQNSC